MRLICTLHDQSKAYRLSTYLNQQGINNQLELITNTNWGSPDYGEVVCNIWIYEEEQLETALAIVEEFEKNSEDPKFYVQPSRSTIAQPATGQEEIPSELVRERQPMGAVTFYILMLCILLFFVGSSTAPNVTSIPTDIPYMPLFSPPINKLLLYDYPLAYEKIDDIVNTYGLESLDKSHNINADEKALLTQAKKTPYWEGFYDQIVAYFKTGTNITINAPLFEKIRQGEIWRTITPIFLHSDIFHLLFNMVWLVVLGKQIEERIGKLRYVLFIIIAAIITNTAQYLMSGPNFLGFSGVLCAMLTFIWSRQKIAGWEGYQLDRGTMAFITFFILFMFGIQLFSFILEIQSGKTTGIGIANTAHLTGAVIGFILARWNLFSWQH